METKSQFEIDANSEKKINYDGGSIHLATYNLISIRASLRLMALGLKHSKTKVSDINKYLGLPANTSIQRTLSIVNELITMLKYS